MPFQAGPVHEVKANLFRVLGHPARVRILELLRDGERSVGTLQTELELDSSGTSQHLAALRRIGLVASRRDGNERLLPRRRRGGVRPARRRPGDHQPPARDRAVDPARARVRVTAALLLAAVALLGLGSAACAASADVSRRAAQSRPSAPRCSERSASGRSLRARPSARLHERLHAALRRRRPDSVLPRDARPRRARRRSPSRRATSTPDREAESPPLSPACSCSRSPRCCARATR